MKKTSLVLLVLIVVCTFFNWSVEVLSTSRANSNIMAIQWLYHFPLIIVFILLGFVSVCLNLKLLAQRLLMLISFGGLFISLVYLPVEMFNWKLITTKEYLHAILVVMLQPAYYLATLLSFVGMILGVIHLMKKGER